MSDRQMEDNLLLTCLVAALDRFIIFQGSMPSAESQGAGRVVQMDSLAAVQLPLTPLRFLSIIGLLYLTAQNA